MTDNEIIKANDILSKFDLFGGQRAGRELWFDKPVDAQNEDIENFSKDVAFLKDFINRQQAENKEKDEMLSAQSEIIKMLERANEEFFYNLSGVMHYVDKWLDGEELGQDVVNRTMTMREKTLQITEKQQAEIERLKEEIEEANKADREAELQALTENREKAKMFSEAIEHAKAEAIKEFAHLLVDKAEKGIVWACDVVDLCHDLTNVLPKEGTDV